MTENKPRKKRIRVNESELESVKETRRKEYDSNLPLGRVIALMCKDVAADNNGVTL